jgi:hypothetical protein
MHAVSMHLRVTARRHCVNIINYGICDKRTGLKEMNRPKLNFRDIRHIRKADSTTFTVRKADIPVLVVVIIYYSMQEHLQSKFFRRFVKLQYQILDMLTFLNGS